MEFQFESFQAMLAMGRHGPYVWGCYAMTFAVLLALVLASSFRRKRFLLGQRRLQNIPRQNVQATGNS